jgi:dCTP deaminase
MEELALPSGISGKANPKSTTGRLDVFARLITDYAEYFDRVPKGYRGRLFVEVAPKSFSVLVHEGTKLNQLRLMRGTPPRSDSSLAALQEDETLVYQEGGVPGRATIADKGLWFSIDLGGQPGTEIIGWKAIAHAPIVDLDQIDYYSPLDFWEPIYSPRKPYLILDQNAFYILRSKERVRVPTGYAAEMIPYDPSVGEFRVHYAGFFDPGFGYGSGDIPGTRAVLEVRLHEVPYVLRDGQWLGRLVYERLLERPAKVYGTDSGSSYQYQDLGLSKQFKLSDVRTRP